MTLRTAEATRVSRTAVQTPREKEAQTKDTHRRQLLETDSAPPLKGTGVNARKSLQNHQGHQNKTSPSNQRGGPENETY